MIEFNIFYKLAAALGIGFIIGMQRENSYSRNNSRHPAGLCSFSIVSLCGALSCYLGDLMGSIVPFVVGLVIVGLLLVASHIAYGLSNQNNGGPAGVTTSAALIMIYFLGALCWFNRLLEACILMIVLLWLLAVKRQLHDFAKKISTEDIIATVKFAVISLMVLPFLPNHAYGPAGLEVLNPHTIWLFVVFICGIGFVGYVLIKLVGPGKGIWLTGLTLGIVLSWSVMYARLYLICVFLMPSLALPLLAPLLVPVVPGLGYAAYLKLRESKDHRQKTTDFNNPFKLLPAIKFGLVFTVVMFIANAAHAYFGSGALMICSFLGGAAEMDAVAFSLIDMCRKATLEHHNLILALLFASLANTLTKGCMVYFLGAKSMRRPILPAVGLICGVSVVMIGIYSVV